jgi:hypothetical protein
MEEIRIRKFAYLKKPVYTWWYENKFGGGFSNSSSYRTLESCIQNAKYMIKDITVPIRIFDVDIDGNETEVKGE